MLKYAGVLLIALNLTSLTAQQNTLISGRIVDNKGPVAFAQLYTSDLTEGAMVDEQGYFSLSLAPGSYVLHVRAQGYRLFSKNLSVKTEALTDLVLELQPDALGLDEVVISASRNRVEKRSAPVVVSTLKENLFEAVQSTSLSDVLGFAPGVRVETNCQNCGFTQVRLNGLEGPYTQILLNNKPVFTSLIAVYGLEQIPTNTIERVEIVRSGGSALYGSNAIAGTINIITKDPLRNTWEVNSNLSIINGNTLDRLLSASTSLVADNLKSGISVFGNYRNRDSFDANGDGFTELVELTNNTFGTKLFVRPSDYFKLTVDATAIKEYRRGGDRLNLAPQFTDITEELDHDTFFGGLQAEIHNKAYTQKWDIYSSTSFTNRDSYYGGLGGGRTAQDSITANNAFGTTKDLAWISGVQHWVKFKSGNQLTSGLEYNLNTTEDGIPGYNRLIDQTVHSFGIYTQYEQRIGEKVNVLGGARLDRIDVVGTYQVGELRRQIDQLLWALSPRITLAYQVTDQFKFRGGYARGFRAPQAFNEDIHISSVGGEPQFVLLSDNLKTEFSDAFTASLNFTSAQNLRQWDILLEGFLTQLSNPFTTVSTGAALPNGSILEEVRNGEGARVYGSNFEAGFSPNPDWIFQLGGTWQNSRYNQPQALFEPEDSSSGEAVFIEQFVRVPNFYGYFNSSWKPSKKFNADLTAQYTGPMEVPRVINAEGQIELNRSQAFLDLNLKLETHFHLMEAFQVTLSGGVKNMFNSYQNDFESGPLRDSDYIYGPASPRMFFFGLKIGRFD